MTGFYLDDCTIVRETDKAILVRIGDQDDNEVWIPKSQIHDDSDIWKEGESGRLIITEWIAKQKGFL